LNRLGIFYGTWTTEYNADFMKYTKKAADAGFDVIELMADVIDGMDKQSRKDLKSLGDDLGIGFTFAADPPAQYDVTSPETGVRDRAVEKLKGYLRIVNEFDSHIACGIVNGVWNSKIVDSKEEHTKRSLDSMRKLMPLAEELDVDICLEVVNRFEYFMLNTCREALAYIGQVGSRNLKVQLDTFHMNIEEDSFEAAILEAGDQLGYFHAGENNRKPPGTGFLPWGEIFGALKKIDYKGVVSLESFVEKGGDFGESCSVWRDLMPGSDIDTEVVKANRFLRRMMAN